MAAQDAHAADPARVPAEEVRARARLFRSVVEADGRRTSADEDGSLMVSLIQRVDYSNQLLLALLNTQRAAVSALSPRTLCGLLIVVHSSMPSLCLGGVRAILLGRAPCVPAALPLRVLLPSRLSLPLWAVPLLCLAVCLLLCPLRSLPRCPPRPPVRLLLLAPLALGPPLPLRPPRVSGQGRRRRRSRRRRRTPRVVVAVGRRVPVVRLVKLRLECGLSLLGLLLFFCFPFASASGLRPFGVVLMVVGWLLLGVVVGCCLRGGCAVLALPPTMLLAS